MYVNHWGEGAWDGTNAIGYAKAKSQGHRKGRAQGYKGGWSRRRENDVNKPGGKLQEESRGRKHVSNFPTLATIVAIGDTRQHSMQGRARGNMGVCVGLKRRKSQAIRVRGGHREHRYRFDQWVVR